MPAFSRLKYVYLAYFSKPARDRAVYQAIYRRRARRILEIGIGTGQRALRMIDLARSLHTGESVHYTGIDLFESRTGGGQTGGLSLKEAHRLLKKTSARVQLAPGDPLAALARTANALSNTDVVVVSAELDPQSLSQAWFYLPRMLHAQSRVFQEVRESETGNLVLRSVDRGEVDSRAAMSRPRRAA